MLGKKLIEAASGSGGGDVPSIGNAFSPFLYTGNGSAQSIPSGINLMSEGGMLWIKSRDYAFGTGHYLYDTARGVGRALVTNVTDPQTAVDNRLTSFNTSGFSVGSVGGTAINANGYRYVSCTFRKASGFFDVVTYTGTGVARTVTHSLGSSPRCIIVKRTDSAGNWCVRHSSLAAGQSLYLNETNAAATDAGIWTTTGPTSTEFSLGTDPDVNASGGTYVAYLFTILTGVSRVGSYTGTGTTLNINCGFSTGARFVLIKRTDSTGAWYYWDTARGIVAGNEPYLVFNTKDPENASTDYIDPLSSGFQITSTAPAAINADGGSYIFLAIA